MSAAQTDTISTMPTTSRTPSGGFQTADGTLYVSKPFRSKTSKKLRAMITFAPRKSHFDIGNESSGTNEFRVSSIAYLHAPSEPFARRDSSLSSGYPCSSSLSEHTSEALKQAAMPSIYTLLQVFPKTPLSLLLATAYWLPAPRFVCRSPKQSAEGGSSIIGSAWRYNTLYKLLCFLLPSLGRSTGNDSRITACAY